MRRKVLLALGGGVVLALVGAVVAIGPRNVIGMLRYDIRQQGKLVVGDRAVDVELSTLDGARVHLLDKLTSKPTVLILGSFT
jgi:hypothetical protein